MGTSYVKSSHTGPNIGELVWRVANDADTRKLQRLVQNREESAKCKAVADLRRDGYLLLESSSLATFNKKMKAYIKGHGFEEETDYLPSVDFTMDNIEDDDN